MLAPMAEAVAELNPTLLKAFKEKVKSSSAETPQEIDVASNPFEDKTMMNLQWQYDGLFKLDAVKRALTKQGREMI
jgi:hypothetical protein